MISQSQCCKEELKRQHSFKSVAHKVYTAKEKERFIGSREKQNSGDSEMSSIQIRQCQAGSAHNVYVAEQRKHEQQMRLNRLHQFIREHMAERDRKTNKKERSIQTFKKDQKKAIFLNYDLRYVS